MGIIKEEHREIVDPWKEEAVIYRKPQEEEEIKSYDIDDYCRMVKETNLRAWQRLCKEQQLAFIKLGRWLEITRLNFKDHSNRSNLELCSECGHKELIRPGRKICYRCLYKKYNMKLMRNSA